MEKIFITQAQQGYCGQLQLTRTTFMDAYMALLNGQPVEQEELVPRYALNQSYPHFKTAFCELQPEIANSTSVQTALAAAYERILYFGYIADVTAEYQQFQIPKRSGGFRTINAPSPRLKEIQRTVVSALTYDLHMHPHEAAHAYITGRSPKTSLEIHQANKSNWFLKLDIKDFFPSCTKDFVVAQLSRLYPLCLRAQNFTRTWGFDNCFLNNALPQGAVSSPLLSNLTMLPIDFAMGVLSKEFHQRFIYTRYADDILISSEFAFDFHAIEEYVSSVVFKDTPFKIKHEKTRYGSIAGQNWNLGLMLNKDNQITVGHQRKEIFKHSVFNLLTDYKNHIAWSAEDKLSLGGMRSYIQNIEPDYVKGVIDFYEKKIGVRWADAIKIL